MCCSVCILDKKVTLLSPIKAETEPGQVYYINKYYKIFYKVDKIRKKVRKWLLCPFFCKLNSLDTSEASKTTSCRVCKMRGSIMLAIMAVSVFMHTGTHPPFE